MFSATPLGRSGRAVANQLPLRAYGWQSDWPTQSAEAPKRTASQRRPARRSAQHASGVPSSAASA
eukprot:COSAG06_NODE_10442_length_1680_cov_3.609741_3_plen_64_part_01